MSAQVYYELKAALALFSKSPGALDDAENARVKAVARRYTEIESVVLASSEAQGVCLAEGAVDKAVGEIRGRYEDEGAFALELEAAGLDLPGLTAALQRDLLVEAVMERVGARAGSVDETEAEIFYYAHVDRFRAPERRTVRHILVTINDAYPDNRREVASRRIHEICKRLNNKPERFEEQAMKHSECPTALNGGLLGELPRGTLYPELDAVLFEMKAGQLSGVVESEIGFHLLRCDAIQPERVLSFAEVSESLRQQLTAERGRKDARRWLTELLKRTTAEAVATN
ncbi:nitrogen fixation protein NifM [Azoarcus olearius]|uniref:peptidylprolyl isomerase n=1 Tax=Azoarcus sp. (strain BH72) TaxID=418699 RepID=A1K2V8_AZOSB|nr:nitrogen fixation protein NifM [Azoarcus olearius]ANQ83632.1 peptidyl-prolyl isomerase [Azoarcus olearius]CAL93163.1 probable peptidylprolyl isomerase [Azoarcus olearius]